MSGGFFGSLAWSGNRIDATGGYTVLYDVVNQPPGTEPLIRFFNEDWASADWQVTNMAKSLFLVFDGPIAAGELPFVLGSGEWVCNAPNDCDYYESGMEIGGVARAAPVSASARVSVPEPGSLVLLALGLLAL